MKRILITILFSAAIVFSSNCFAQQIISPINAPLIIAGAFGEPREGHFHTGVDFTTRHKTGIEVYAVMDGYVSRIKVSPYGYGNALYVIHPNGLMSVYGHLSRFNAAIQKYVTEQQYKTQKFEQEIYPTKEQFVVKKGEVIAYSGNTGGSTAPHLHFEIRDAKGESFPLNPLAYKLPLKDTIPPILRKLAVYDLNYICCGDWQNPVEYNLVKTGGVYKLHAGNQPDTIVVHSSKLGFGIKAIDLMNGADADGDFGVYSLQMKVDNATVFDFSMDRIDFSEGNYANAEIDFRRKMKDHDEIYRCYLLPGNKASIYKNIVKRGIVELTDNALHKIEITASDFFKNTASVSFYVCKKAIPLTEEQKRLMSSNIALNPAPNFPPVFDFDKPNTITTNNVKAVFPPNTFFENVVFEWDSIHSTSKAALSEEYYLHDEFVPLHQSFELFIKPNKKIAEKYKSKAMIVSVKGNGNMSGYTSTWENGYVKAKPSGLGRFCVAVDTIAPFVAPKNFKPATLLHNHTLIFDYSDNMSGTKDYNIYVDDKWTLLEYDPKIGLICNLGKNFAAGEHSVKVIVSDNVGNKKTYKYKIRL